MGNNTGKSPQICQRTAFAKLWLQTAEPGRLEIPDFAGTGGREEILHDAGAETIQRTVDRDWRGDGTGGRSCPVRQYRQHRYDASEQSAGKPERTDGITTVPATVIQHTGLMFCLAEHQNRQSREVPFPATCLFNESGADTAHGCGTNVL